MSEIKSDILLDEFKKKNTFFEKTTEKYLDVIEFSHVFIKEKFKSFCASIPDPNSRIFVHLTIILVIVTFFILMISCAHPQQNAGNKRQNPYSPPAVPAPQNEQASAQGAPSESYERNKETEQIFFGRDQLFIKPREEGSSTGSIWADSPQPNSYFAESRPSRIGEIVNVIMPPSNPQGKPSSMKFEIAALDPTTGDAYLRSSKNVLGADGESKNLQVTARVPLRSIYGYDVDARSLNQIALNEESGDENYNYATTGWDDTVAKKLSEFSGDLSPSQGKTGEKPLSAKELKDQQKALQEEKDRVQKSRDRLAQQEQNILRNQPPNPPPVQGNKNNTGNAGNGGKK